MPSPLSGDTATPTQTDLVFIDSLQLSADVGPDCWGKQRAQPISISIYLHLHSAYLTAAGTSDSVLDSMHYGHLSKSISGLVKERADSSFGDVDALVGAVTAAAFALAGDAASEVRVVVSLPKYILLAAGFSVDVTTTSRGQTSKRVVVEDLVLPVIIGVNPPEREAKQRVITNVVLFEDANGHDPVDYPGVVAGMVKVIETSSYLTLEKFVLEVARAACLASGGILAVTVRAQKPSALSFAHSSGVEITRQRSSFLSTQ